MRSLLLMVLICVVSPTLRAQDAAPSASKEHAYLAKIAGTRSGTMKVWPQGPTSDAMEFPFTETNTVILGGNWVETEFQAGPYKGHGMNGYDPIKKKYIGTWANNMSPYLAVMEGRHRSGDQPAGEDEVCHIGCSWRALNDDDVQNG